MIYRNKGELSWVLEFILFFGLIFYHKSKIIKRDYSLKITIMNDKDDKGESKDQSAKEIAEIMVQNMIANMKDPNFLIEKERRLQKAASEVIATRKKKQKISDESEDNNQVE